MRPARQPTQRAAVEQSRPGCGRTLTGVEQRYVRALPSDQLGHSARQVELADGPVLVRRLADGHAVAFQRDCPHQGQSLRGGILTGVTLECIRHFYAYDLRSGANTFPGDEDDKPLTIYETVERDGWVWIGPPKAPDGRDGHRPASDRGAEG